MINSTLRKITTVVFIMTVVTVLVAGCTKPPDFKPDPVNPYANPNNPNVGTATPVLNNFTPTSGIANTVIRIAIQFCRRGCQ
jgi:hypothetical protein